MADNKTPKSIDSEAESVEPAAVEQPADTAVTVEPADTAVTVEPAAEPADTAEPAEPAAEPAAAPADEPAVTVVTAEPAVTAVTDEPAGDVAERDAAVECVVVKEAASSSSPSIVAAPHGDPTANNDDTVTEGTEDKADIPSVPTVRSVQPPKSKAKATLTTGGGKGGAAGIQVKSQVVGKRAHPAASMHDAASAMMVKETLDCVVSCMESAASGATTMFECKDSVLSCIDVVKNNVAKGFMKEANVLIEMKKVAVKTIAMCQQDSKFRSALRKDGDMMPDEELMKCMNDISRAIDNYKNELGATVKAKTVANKKMKETVDDADDSAAVGAV